MISEKDLYTIVNLVDLHSRTSDQEISMKIKNVINVIIDDVLLKTDEVVPHELKD